MAQSRRDFLRGGAAAAAGLVAARATLADPAPQHEGHTHPAPQPAPAPAAPAPRARGKGGPAEPPAPVLAPDVSKLPFRWDNGVKVFHLIAEPVRAQFTPWKTANVWGYNGSSPGPTIEAVEGDRVRVILENRLPEATVPHWHGLEVPIEMDGVEGITQDFIPPGGSYTYEFTLRQNGTFFYHSHRPMQQMMGMVGLFIVHPKRPHEPRCDRDFAFVLQEWATPGPEP